MKTTDPSLLAFLTANRQFFQADLFDFAMVDGSHLYLTSANVSIEYEGNLYLATGPYMERSKLRQSRGTSVDSLVLTCHVSQAMTAAAVSAGGWLVTPAYQDPGFLMGEDTTTPLFGGAGLPQALLQGALDGAYLTMSRLIFASWDNPTQFAPVILFYGRVADISSVGYSKIQITVKSFLELLDMYYPWQLYQAACSWALYDANCQVNPDNFVQGGVVVASAGNTALAFLTNLIQTDGWFTLGRIQMTSGVCAPQLRSIKNYQGGIVTPMVPFVGGPPAAGDQFQAWAGCDRQLGTCATKFNNLGNFGGQPFIPAPSTVIS
jgi:uncharacterized phage protein (TIGR02218 family)